jgi:hypothetical protein
MYGHAIMSKSTKTLASGSTHAYQHYKTISEKCVKFTKAHSNCRLLVYAQSGYSNDILKAPVFHNWGSEACAQRLLELLRQESARLDSAAQSCISARS